MEGAKAVVVPWSVKPEHGEQWRLKAIANSFFLHLYKKIPDEREHPHS